MEIAGYIAPVLIGVSLGLIGGGGSILTVPVLVYLFHVDVVLATAYSLFIVGATSVIGSFSYFKRGLVNSKTAIIFGVPSIVSVFLTRQYIVPVIPESIQLFDGLLITKGVLIMLLFAVLMLLAAYSMIKTQAPVQEEVAGRQQFNYPLIFLEGTFVGALTGLVGAGGGFLIIPALVILSKLPMKEAVGTSLVIIAAKSLIGFLGERERGLIDWSFLVPITLLAIAGVFVGFALSKRIDGEKLKPAFGWFVLAMSVYILFKEILMA